MTTERVRIDLAGAPQTMLATLYAKALDADFDEPILGDRFAKQIVERIDYDWRKTTITARRAQWRWFLRWPTCPNTIATHLERPDFSRDGNLARRRVLHKLFTREETSP